MMRIYLGRPSQTSAVKARATGTLRAESMSSHRGAEQGLQETCGKLGGCGRVLVRGMGKY